MLCVGIEVGSRLPMTTRKQKQRANAKCHRRLQELALKITGSVIILACGGGVAASIATPQHAQGVWSSVTPLIITPLGCIAALAGERAVRTNSRCGKRRKVK